MLTLVSLEVLRQRFGSKKSLLYFDVKMHAQRATSEDCRECIEICTSEL